ncbi:MAG TPA: ImmA/IrrE family metallo-endopeptidase [Vicinamibacteria bacterium]|nr:ImmA/IrrE family metallo-endopeptidase [Vicinamibacteria bacterium]
MRDHARAVRLATDLRRELQLTERVIELPRLLSDMEIRLRFEALPGDVEGLTRDGQIFVDPCQGQRRRRFTIAHELGHHLLGHGLASCSGPAIHGNPSDRREQEANTFAASLLMPARLFREDVRTAHPCFDEIGHLADAYDVSLTAASIRYVRFTRDSCAVLGVRPPEPPWLSKNWEQAWFLALPPGEGTLIYAHLEGDSASQKAQVAAGAWFENFIWDTPATIQEEVIRTSTCTWLVLLSEIPDYDDDPDLIEREAAAELERRRRSFRRF